ncbi:mannose-1-phosphate guanylyltransferase [Fulvivirga sp. 29W222]|uniref:mannose-1-phosphate guanylyltransferase n=1 Tax=Fulvivirga marina TaxID=2494733 RepID=A0A937FYI4_9BACT|nr:mannose-1-phosphate guanylyltransferase [Fulvivirga marina]MBL6446858.1 mannose-1-phosphate guanylyltransferase [Fulvivirga marina]
MKNNYVVIMAGGIGSRFWPYSRNNQPKQFLDILGTGRSLLQMTYDRFLPVVNKENIYVVTNNDYATLVKEQLPDLTEHQILKEPLRRNTAPCIAYASYKIAKQDPDAIIMVAPSDHIIFNEEKFYSVLKTAISAANGQNKLLTIGLKPNRPETGYGYIQFLESKEKVNRVKTFTEKPERDLAQKFLESGDFVWNSGIFVWGVQAIIQAFEECLPEIAETFADIQKALFTEREPRAVDDAYSQCGNISIDYGVMEKADNVYVVLGDFGWSDLGSWNSLHELSEKNGEGNVIQGNAITYDTKNSLIHGPKERLIVVQGLDGYLVAECGNVTLICKKDEEAKFRDFVADVRDKKGKEFL